MKIIKKNFFSNLDKNFLFEKKPSIAVAVSGGPDSLALVYLMNEWIKKNKGDIIALLIDHKLRVESFNECIITKKYLKKFNIKSKIIRIASSKLKKKNMHEARLNRYNELIYYCNKQKILHLFIGHHYDDNLETFLIRKTACSNLEGLNSMSFSTLFDRIQIIRPFLQYSKKEIIQFNNLNKINFNIDPSNYNNRYTRVVIRKFLKNTQYINKIKKDFEMTTSYVPYYKLMINEILHKLILSIKRNSITISKKDFEKLDKIIKAKIIEKFFYYFKKGNSKLRYSKIISLFSEIDKVGVKSYNLGSMKIKKNKHFLKFSNIN